MFQKINTLKTDKNGFVLHFTKNKKTLVAANITKKKK